MSDQQAIKKATLLDKIGWRLFPQKYHEPLPEEAGYALGDLSTNIVVYVDLVDRFRILVSGKIKIMARTKTDVLVNKVKTVSVFSVLPPWRTP